MPHRYPIDRPVEVPQLQYPEPSEIPYTPWQRVLGTLGSLPIQVTQRGRTNEGLGLLVGLGLALAQREAGRQRELGGFVRAKEQERQRTISDAARELRAHQYRLKEIAATAESRPREVPKPTRIVPEAVARAAGDPTMAGTALEIDQYLRFLEERRKPAGPRQRQRVRRAPLGAAADMKALRVKMREIEADPYTPEPQKQRDLYGLRSAIRGLGEPAALEMLANAETEQDLDQAYEFILENQLQTPRVMSVFRTTEERIVGDR